MTLRFRKCPSAGIINSKWSQKHICSNNFLNTHLKFTESKQILRFQIHPLLTRGIFETASRRNQDKLKFGCLKCFVQQLFQQLIDQVLSVS